MEELRLLMEENKEWLNPKVKETPYWRDGMTPEEYDIEREYYYMHLDDVRKGIYKPLWKQRSTPQ